MNDDEPGGPFEAFEAVHNIVGMLAIIAALPAIVRATPGATRGMAWLAWDYVAPVRRLVADAYSRLHRPREE